jgi:hypothetical protein
MHKNSNREIECLWHRINPHLSLQTDKRHTQDADDHVCAKFDVMYIPHNHSTHKREDETTVYILFLKGCTFQWSNTEGTFQAKAAGNTQGAFRETSAG